MQIFSLDFGTNGAPYTTLNVLNKGMMKQDRDVTGYRVGGQLTGDN